MKHTDTHTNHVSQTQTHTHTHTHRSLLGFDGSRHPRLLQAALSLLQLGGGVGWGGKGHAGVLDEGLAGHGATSHPPRQQATTLHGS